MTKYFSGINNLDELKKAFLKLAKKLHPDNGGNASDFQEMKNEFDKLVKHFEMFGKYATNNPDDNETSENNSFDFGLYADIISQLAGLDGLIIELVGTWLWVSGETFPHKDVLKSLKFRWSSKKRAWYFHFEPYHKRSKKQYSLDDIRGMFGSQTFKGASRPTFKPV